MFYKIVLLIDWTCIYFIFIYVRKIEVDIVGNNCMVLLGDQVHVFGLHIYVENFVPYTLTKVLWDSIFCELNHVHQLFIYTQIYTHSWLVCVHQRLWYIWYIDFTEI